MPSSTESILSSADFLAVALGAKEGTSVAVEKPRSHSNSRSGSSRCNHQLSSWNGKARADAHAKIGARVAMAHQGGAAALAALLVTMEWYFFDYCLPGSYR